MLGPRNVPLPRASTVIACLALFLALGGAAYAGSKLKLKPNSVGTKQLKDGAVTNGKLGDGAVTAGKLAGASVTKAKFAASGVATVTNGATIGSTFCNQIFLSAPGVEPGDLVLITPGTLSNSFLSVDEPSDTVPAANQLVLMYCNHSAGPVTVNVGEQNIRYVALR